ncbi:MAG: hypothetical protein H7175_06145 [Burkholderiales bacterium]|nr:hypothetical protein [Anaerolineae bacterium]
MNTGLKLAFIRGAVAVGGSFYLLTGIALLFAPQWFFDNVGTFPPFNRHYAGDLGSYLLPLGIVLLLAVRHPAQHRSLIGFAAAGTFVHALNHVYEDIQLGSAFPVWFAATIPLLVYGLVLAAAYVIMKPTLLAKR